jgi:hypothetical protein
MCLSAYAQAQLSTPAPATAIADGAAQVGAAASAVATPAVDTGEGKPGLTQTAAGGAGATLPDQTESIVSQCRSHVTYTSTMCHPAQSGKRGKVTVSGNSAQALSDAENQRAGEIQQAINACQAATATCLSRCADEMAACPTCNADKFRKTQGLCSFDSELDAMKRDLAAAKDNSKHAGDAGKETQTASKDETKREIPIGSAGPSGGTVPVSPNPSAPEIPGDTTRPSPLPTGMNPASKDSETKAGENSEHEQARQERRAERRAAMMQAMQTVATMEMMTAANQMLPVNAQFTGPNQQPAGAATNAASSAPNAMAPESARRPASVSDGRGGFFQRANNRGGTPGAQTANATSVPGNSAAYAPNASGGSLGGSMGQASAAGNFGQSAGVNQLDARKPYDGKAHTDASQLVKRPFGEPDGGGGGGGGSTSRPMNQMSLQDYLPNGPRYQAQRGPAGLQAEKTGIQNKAVDIWGQISIRFRTHCLDGRLRDCRISSK